LNWRVTEQFTLRVFGGSAFRAPSFTDLYNQNNPATLGNADVKPEKITTYELGSDYQFSDNLRSALTLFSYRADSLIDLAPSLMTLNKPLITLMFIFRYFYPLSLYF
jgi:outer membrane receptor for ferrienterochelin and colicins